MLELCQVGKGWYLPALATRERTIARTAEVSVGLSMVPENLRQLHLLGMK